MNAQKLEVIQDPDGTPLGVYLDGVQVQNLTGIKTRTLSKAEISGDMPEDAREVTLKFVPSEFDWR